MKFTLMLLVLVAGFSGCHRRATKDLPKTYPVSGIIVAPEGQLPPAGSMIQFQPENANWAADGRIEADGTFTLSVLFDQKRLPGATSGPHRATIYPILEHSRGEPISIDQPYTVEPRENHFTITLK